MKAAMKQAHEIPAEETVESRQQPVWHVVILAWATWLFYLIYWFYKNWRDLKRQANQEMLVSGAMAAVAKQKSGAGGQGHEVPAGAPGLPGAGGESTGATGSGQSGASFPAEGQRSQAGDPLKAFVNISPGWRTAGLFIPVLNIFLNVTQLLGIMQLHPDIRSFPRRHPFVATGLVLGAAIGCTFFSLLRMPFAMLTLLGAFPIAMAQHWLNDYWASVEPASLPVRHAFTWKEILVILFGFMNLGLIVVGYMIGVPGVAPD